MKEVVRRLQRRITYAIWLVTLAGACLAVATWVSDRGGVWYWLAMAGAVLCLVVAMVVLPTTNRVDQELNTAAIHERNQGI